MKPATSVRRVVGLVFALAVLPAGLHAQSAGALPERAVRRDIPLTNMIRRAFEAGTRDSTGTPGPNYWQLEVDYSIDARLDPGHGTVSGRESVVIHNNSPDSLTMVVLRLDQNIFSPSAARNRGLNDITSGTAVSAISLDGVPLDLNAVPPRRRRGQPPVPLDQSYVFGLNTTSAQIALKDPIHAGENATLDITWSFEVPVAEGGRGLRMGAWGDSLFQVAQWYPQVAKYDDLRGWDTEPYLGSSEFYNNFGRFDVRIDVPAGWVVGASGVLQNPAEVLSARTLERLSGVAASDETRTIVGTEDFGAGTATAGGDRLVWHFVAEYVNDFAWATSAQYVWQATGVAIPGGERIPFHWMYLPGDSSGFEGADARGRHALQFYSDLWMPYAFPQLTMVDGPDTGMEYPMLVMSALGAEDHEIGHEWWPMMVGTNETWYGFMDEGFNQYMNMLSRAHRLGEEPQIDGLGQSYGRISGDEREAPLMWNANYGGPMYGFQAYSKAPLMLSMLGGVVGDEEVWRAMSGYAHTWRFKHPSPWDYMFFMNDALGRDLGWFWYSWLFTTESVDGSIASVARSGAGTKVTVRQEGQMPSPVVLRIAFRNEAPSVEGVPNAMMGSDGSVMVRYPVDVWFGGSRTFEVELPFPLDAVESVVLDPHGRFPDRDPSDNAWTAPGM
ncbi:MAG: M1 family metallopeptidase [Gemmatimonadota bacterium]